jgi:hypothetical protein
VLATTDKIHLQNSTGSLMTKQAFGNCQLHIEWATPEEVGGKGRAGAIAAGSGNSNRASAGSCAADKKSAGKYPGATLV